MHPRWSGWLGTLILLLAACTVPRPDDGPPPPSDPNIVFEDGPDDGGPPMLRPVVWEDLPGWQRDDLSEALPALRRSCGALGDRGPQAKIDSLFWSGTVADWAPFCTALQATPATARAVQAVLDDHLRPWRIANAQSRVTAYYEAELAGVPPGQDPPAGMVPLLGVPDDLVTIDAGAYAAAFDRDRPSALVGRVAGGRLQPYPDRAAIEAGAIAGRAPVLAWADPIDAHILHIQGSGRVTFPDGQVMRLGFAASNGHPFRGIGSILLERGLLQPGRSSMPDIRAWLQGNRDQGRALMALNPRYIFFRRLDDLPPDLGPVGALGVPLTPLRSVAVDRSQVPLGAPLWLVTAEPDGQPIERLVAAQDVGSAITGPARIDLYWGTGEAAFQRAGRMNQPGTVFVLLPRTTGPTARLPAVP